MDDELYTIPEYMYNVQEMKNFLNANKIGDVLTTGDNKKIYFLKNNTTALYVDNSGLIIALDSRDKNLKKEFGVLVKDFDSFPKKVGGGAN